MTLLSLQSLLLILTFPLKSKPKNLKNKRGDFFFPIVRSPFISSKNFSSKDALLLGWRHRYINSTVAMASQTC